MSNTNRFSLLIVLGIAITFVGCASQQEQQSVRVLQAQVGAITDELVRLDEALMDTRMAIQEEENRRADLQSELKSSSTRLGALREEESVIRGIYRTPSGFTLPSIKIQEALKNAGYYQGKLDGKIGGQTRSAIKSFQADNGLATDGVVGSQTWHKLKVYSAAIK